MPELIKVPNQLLSILVAVLLIFSPTDAQSADTPANELFVNAITLHRQAVNHPPETRDAKLREVRDLFDRILAEHPDSDVAEMIRTNPVPAGVVIANLPPSKSHSLEIDAEPTDGADGNGAPKASSTDVIVGGSVSSADDGILAPVGGVELTASATYFDPDYPTSWNPPAQHLGVDLPAPEGTVVRSPISGTVVVNRTNRSQSFNKYLIVRDSEKEQEHVFGHIDSDLAENTEVRAGSKLGTIVSAGTGPHLHWGINSGSILDTFSEGWGFGRAPLGATRQEAQSRGWLDPEHWFEALAKRTSTPEPRIEESAGPSQVALFEALPDGLYSIRAEVCSHQGKSVVETLDREFRLLNRPRLSMFDVTCDIEGASEANDAVEVTASCNAEGVTEERVFHWQLSSPRGFTEVDAFGGTKKFQLCANTTAPGRAKPDDTTVDATALKERQIGPGLLGPWTVQTEPDLTLKVGEQGRGFAVLADGAATFQGKPLFDDYRAPELDFQRLAIFVDDAERRAVVLFMRDGAERLALVDLEAGKVLNDSPRPVWRYGPTDDVIWDPSGRYAALRMPMAEYSTGLGIFELATGRYATMPDRAFDANALDSWLADSLETRLDGTVSVEVARERLDAYGTPIASDGTPPETRIIEIEAFFDGSVTASDSESASDETAGEPEAGAVANQVWDPRIVVSKETGIFNRTYGDLVSPIDELRAVGVSDRAIAFSRAFAEAADSGKAGEFVAVDFTELGAVDLVRVEPAYTRSTSSPLHSYVLTAREGTIRRLSFPVEMNRNLGRYATDRTSRRVLAGQPDPWIVDHYVTGHRFLPSGAQRFVLQGPVSGSCRVCEWIGHAIVYVDVDERGDVLRQDLVGIIADAAVPDEEITPADIVTRPDLQQYVLNKFGYDAGPMDGAVGPRTRRAIAAFQRDHCLTVTRSLTGPVARALARSNPLKPPDCAVGRPKKDEPARLSPGQTAASAEHAPGQAGGVDTAKSEATKGVATQNFSLTGRYGAGPNCEDASIVVEAGRVTFTERGCSFDTPIPQGVEAHETDASCFGDGMTWRDTLSIRLTSDGSLVVGEAHQRQTFSRCTGSETSFHERVAQTPAASTWSVQSEPTHSISPTETWGPLEVQADGSLYTGKTRIFPTAPDPEATRIDLYVAPDRKRALAIQFDTDWGGVRAHLIALADGARLGGPLISEGSVRGQARPIDVRQPGSPIAWSPDGETLLVTVETAEFEGDIVAIDQTTGSAEALRRPETSDSHWVYPALARLANISTQRPDLPFDILSCSNETCDYPENVGAIRTPWSEAFGGSAPSDSEEELAGVGSHSAAKTQGNESSLEAIQAKLKEKYPDTFDAIFGNPLMSRVSREAKVEVAVLLIEVFESPAVSEAFVQRLNLEFAQFLQLAVGRVSDDLVLPSGGLLGNIGASLAEEVAIEVAAGLATDVLFDLGPPIPTKFESPMRAVFRSTIVELWGVKRGLTGEPGVILGKMVDRYYDIVEIANASRLLAATQDQALLATALSMETAAIAAATLPAETGETIIEEARRSLGFSTEGAVGADDAEAVERIFRVGLEALVAHHAGDAKVTRELRAEIARLGRAEGNINPFSAIRRPVDWLTSAANWGQDAPERAARILIGSTALADISTPPEEAAPQVDLGTDRAKLSDPSNVGSPHGSSVEPNQVLEVVEMSTAQFGGILKAHGVKVESDIDDASERAHVEAEIARYAASYRGTAPIIRSAELPFDAGSFDPETGTLRICGMGLMNTLGMGLTAESALGRGAPRVKFLPKDPWTAFGSLPALCTIGNKSAVHRIEAEYGTGELQKFAVSRGGGLVLAFKTDPKTAALVQSASERGEARSVFDCRMEYREHNPPTPSPYDHNAIGTCIIERVELRAYDREAGHLTTIVFDGVGKVMNPIGEARGEDLDRPAVRASADESSAVARAVWTFQTNAGGEAAIRDIVEGFVGGPVEVILGYANAFPFQTAPSKQLAVDVFGALPEAETGTVSGPERGYGSFVLKNWSELNRFYFKDEPAEGMALATLGTVEDLRILSIEERTGGSCEWYVTYRVWLAEKTQFGKALEQVSDTNGLTFSACFRTTRDGYEISEYRYVD